jgi:hypothetical protein
MQVFVSKGGKQYAPFSLKPLCQFVEAATVPPPTTPAVMEATGRL